MVYNRWVGSIWALANGPLDRNTRVGGWALKKRENSSIIQALNEKSWKTIGYFHAFYYFWPFFIIFRVKNDKKIEIVLKKPGFLIKFSHFICLIVRIESGWVLGG